MQWFKSKVTRVLRDQYIQQWSSEIESKEIYYNYRMFKNVFAPEDYLQILPLNLAYIFLHFRTLNHRLPIQRRRVMNYPFLVTVQIPPLSLMVYPKVRSSVPYCFFCTHNHSHKSRWPKSCDLDPIPTSLLFDCSDVIVPALSL